jgi:hypothetical protein
VITPISPGVKGWKELEYLMKEITPLHFIKGVGEIPFNKGFTVYRVRDKGSEGVYY